MQWQICMKKMSAHNNGEILPEKVEDINKKGKSLEE